MYSVRMHKNIAWLTLLSVILISGCATTGSRQMETVVADMHQRVSILDRDLEPSLNKLNENAADLIARVNENDRQIRLLQSLMEENQHKIDHLLKMLDDLKRALYRHWGLNPGPAMTVPPAGGRVRVVPPVQTGAPARPGGPSPDAPPPPEASAPSIVGDQVAYAAAKEHYDNEDYAGALSVFSRFLDDYKASDLRHQAQFWIGKSYLNQSEYTKAIQAFETIRRDYPDSSYMAYALHNQAVAHFRLGERDTAIALMEEVMANYPTSTAAESARRDLKQLRSR